MTRPLSKRKQKRALTAIGHIVARGMWKDSEKRNHDSTSIGIDQCYFVNLYLQETWAVLKASREHVPSELQARIDRLLEGVSELNDFVDEVYK